MALTHGVRLITLPGIQGMSRFPDPFIPPFTFDFVVSTTGGTGAGTLADPWSLSYAIGSGAGSAQGDGKLTAGKTVAIKGGLYQKATPFDVNTNGNIGSGVDNPDGKILWRNFPQELVIIESTNIGDIESLRLNGSYNWWWATVGKNEGIDVRRSWAENPRNSPRGSTIWIKDVPQDGNKLIHIVAYDGDAGVYMGNSAGNDFRYGNIEFYGFISYNCGHGPMVHHNSYMRHDSPAGEIMRVEGQIGFNSCSQGMQIFSQEVGIGLAGFRVKKCIQFNSGVLGDGSTTTSSYVITDGLAAAFITDFKIEDFVSYHPPGITGNRRPFSIGGADVTNEDAEVARGYMVGGSLGVRIGVFRVDGGPSLNYHDNYYNPRATVQVLQNDQSGSLANYSGWANNAWRRDPTATAWNSGGTSRNFTNWKLATDLGSTDSTPSEPTVNVVFVFDLKKYNQYGHVCFFNYELSSTVAVDISTIINPGETYEVYNVQDLHGDPVLSGTYSGGEIEFPTTGKTPPVPVGVLPRTAPTTAPFFDAFLVRRV